MKNIKIKSIYALSVVIFLFSGASYAQTVPTSTTPVAPATSEELSLENELNQAQTSQESTTPEILVPASQEVLLSQPVPQEVDLATPAAPIINEMELEEQSNIVTSDEFAMNGYSFGALIFNHNYNVSGSVDAINTAGTASIDISTKSSDFQSVGVVGRYAILPFDKLGTDLNVSLGTSANHNSISTSSVTVLKFEVNLGYAIPLSSNALYFLAGLGYEVVKGVDVEKIIVAGGGAAQIGAGLSFGKKLNVEVFFSQSRHAISDNYISNIQNQLIAQGYTSASAAAKNQANSNIISGRVVYNY